MGIVEIKLDAPIIERNSNLAREKKLKFISIALLITCAVSGCSQQSSDSLGVNVTSPAIAEQDLYFEEDIQEYDLDSDVVYEDYLAGADEACSNIFSLSYDDYMYAGGESLYIGDCTYWGGSYDGEYDTPYEEGYRETIEEMFSTTPYWCWDDECVTESDF
jgi:hypothetical protein